MTGQPKVVLLAAGLGSRLGQVSRVRHKCLASVAGRPIIARALDALVAVGIADVTIVVGHLAEQVRRCTTEWSVHLTLNYVLNDRVATTGTAYSLALALTSDPPASEILVVEADVVFDAPLLMRLLDASCSNATLVAPFTQGVSGSAVICGADAVVSDWLHASDQGQDFQRSNAAKTVNLTRLDGPTSTRLLSACRRVAPAAPLEYALRKLVRDCGVLIQAVPVGAEPWCEVDTEIDLHNAERLFRADVLGARE